MSGGLGIISHICDTTSAELILMSFPMVNGIGKIQGYFSDVKPDAVRVGNIISYEPRLAMIFS